MVTGQLADMPTRRLPTRGLDISCTSQLADWTSRRLDNSRSRRCELAVRELAYPQVVQ